MAFANPSAFWLLLLAIPMVAVYLKYATPLRHKVSFSALWWLPTEQTSPRLSRWVWLRFPASLLLQIILLFWITLNAADPITKSPTQTSKDTGADNLILILDNSASMQASDVRPSRFEQAITDALKLVQNVSEETRITLIPSVPNTQSVPNSQRQISACFDRIQIENWLKELQPADAPEDIRYIQQRLQAAIDVSPQVSVVVFSDQRILDFQETRSDTDLSDSTNTITRLKPNYRIYNMDGANIGITAYQVMPSGGSPALATIRATLQNSSRESVRFRLITTADKSQVDSRLIALQPNEVRPIEFTASVGEAKTITSKIAEFETATANTLTVDDSASSTIPREKQVPVLIVSTNRLLVEAVQAVPWVLVSVASQVPEHWPSEGIIVLDSQRFGSDTNSVVTQSLPSLPTIVINPQTSSEYWSYEGGIDGEMTIRSSHSSDAFNGDSTTWSYLDGQKISQVTKLRFVVSVTSFLNAVQEDGSQASLVALLQMGKTRWFVLGANPADSDFALRPAFPLLISQLLLECLPQKSTTLPPFSAGQSTYVFDQLVPDEFFSEEAELRRKSATQRAGQTLVPFYETGLHQLGTQTVFVNLNSPAESDLRPARLPGSGEPLQTPLITQTPLTSQTTTEDSLPASLQQALPEQNDRRTFVLFGLLSVVLLSVEWWLFQRHWV